MDGFVGLTPPSPQAGHQDPKQQAAEKLNPSIPALLLNQKIFKQAQIRAIFRLKGLMDQARELWP